MNKLIQLIEIQCYTSGGAFDVVYKLQIESVPFDLKYTIYSMGVNPEQNRVNEVPNLCDPVIVSLMYHLLVEGYDFKSDIPISNTLYHHLTKDFMPHIVSMSNGKAKPSKLHVPIYNGKIKRHAEWVGTGVSCGIDSFSAIKEYSQEQSDSYKLTHLLYFKIGAHHGRLYPCPEEVENKIFHEELDIANRFCEQNNYKLIVVDSNINQMANKFWGAIPFGNVAWFRNVGVMLVMQEYFSKYVFATSYATFHDFNMDISNGLEHNLWWAMPLLGSDNLKILPAGSSMTRIEKTVFLTDFKPAYDNMMVCWAGHINCGECDKCIRTLVALDFIGALEKFEKSFDIQKYKKNRKKYLEHVVTYAVRDSFFRELCDYAKKNNIKLPNKQLSVIKEYWRLAKKNKLTVLPKLVLNRVKAIISK